MASKRFGDKGNKMTDLNTPADLSKVFDRIINDTCPKGSKDEEEVVDILRNELKIIQDECSLRSVLSLLVFNILPIIALLCLVSPFIYQIVTQSACLVTLGPAGELVGSPIEDCGFCANLTEVPRLSNVEVFDFVFNYHSKNIPIIVTDATQKWPAMDIISYEYLKGLYADNPKAQEYDTDNGQFFKYSSDLNGLHDLFNLSEERTTLSGKRWYIGWSTNDPIISEEISKHFSLPYFIPPQPMIENRVAWIFMGSPGPGAYMHLDSVQFSSWQAQLRGKKTWMLAPYPDCEHVCRKLNATMNTGDMIVVDTNRWVHGTFIHPEGMSITIGSEFE